MCAENEIETTINILYDEKCILIYTNKSSLQRELKKVLGKPEKEFKKGKVILASRWKVRFEEKTKISQMMLKANIFEL